MKEKYNHIDLHTSKTIKEEKKYLPAHKPNYSSFEDEEDDFYRLEEELSIILKKMKHNKKSNVKLQKD